jgi:hypothetical protein
MKIDRNNIRDVLGLMVKEFHFFDEDSIWESTVKFRNDSVLIYNVYGMDRDVGSSLNNISVGFLKDYDVSSINISHDDSYPNGSSSYVITLK